MAVAGASTKELVGADAYPGDTEAVFRRQLVFAFGWFELLVTSFSCVTELAWGTRALGILYGIALVPIGVALVVLRKAGPSDAGAIGRRHRRTPASLPQGE